MPLLWPGSYATSLNCLPCALYSSQGEEIERSNTAPAHTCPEGQWLLHAEGCRKLTELVSMDKSPYSFGPSWMQQKPQSKPLTVSLSINTVLITEYTELNLYHVVILFKTEKT